MTIKSPEAPIRLDKHLVFIDPSKSRSEWARMIEKEAVLVDNRAVSKHFEVQPTQKITFTEPEAEPQADAVEIPILAETADYIVINKPTGVAAHKTSMTDTQFTVADFAVAHDARIAGVGDKPAERPGIVHRLDKEVTGVMIIAKTQEAFLHLKAQFAARTVQKEYLALVHGEVKSSSIELDFPITRSKRSGLMCSLPLSSLEGDEAKTTIETITATPHASYVLALPKTGRTHQIRVHCKAFGHPIVGDKLYSSMNTTLDERAPRTMLHAHKLTILTPDGLTPTFEAVPPQDFVEYVKKGLR